jgi:hypothetical protein
MIHVNNSIMNSFSIRWKQDGVINLIVIEQEVSHTYT